ncbi:MAG: hypothetical protein QOI20_1633, partial [Acidimicrobiaceae bacterium]|nr:hypothetical protein [Acidimicrobiaceae bacterium]
MPERTRTWLYLIVLLLLVGGVVGALV